jgi:hypothetical protein
VDDLLLGLGITVLALFCALIVVLLAALLESPQGQVLTQRREAELRAYTLLKRWLSPEQIAQLERHGYFEVRGSHSGTCYRIHRERNMNIDQLVGEGSRVAVWCFGPMGNLPLGDNLLAQKIALETDEQAALAVANRSWPERRRNLPNAGANSGVTPAIARQT